jgi:hypothetical protein
MELRWIERKTGEVITTTDAFGIDHNFAEAEKVLQWRYWKHLGGEVYSGNPEWQDVPTVKQEQ